METGLDVLSTLAASMVESKAKTGDSILGTGSTCPAPPPLDSSSYDLAAASTAAAAAAAAAQAASSASVKDLPTRGLKSERAKERQDLCAVLHLDKEHAASLCAARKTVSTASTQTQFTSFNGEAAPPYPGPPPQGPPPAYFAPRGDGHAIDSFPQHHHSHHHHHHHHPVYGPPPPLPHPSSALSSSSPPSSSSSHLVDLSHSRASSSADVQNAPLNLSLSSGLPPVSLSSSSSASSSVVVSSSLSLSSTVSSAWQPHRGSVITCLSSSSPGSSGGSSPKGPSHNGHQGGGGGDNGRASPASAVSDPAIEEHFRRSLASYGDCVPKTSAGSLASQEPNVSITGSVDDHFAKALGDSTWKALKSQSDAAAAPEVFTGSVDEHFAKALGANTWRRIKAETEHSESSGGVAFTPTTTTIITPTPSNPTSARHGLGGERSSPSLSSSPTTSSSPPSSSQSTSAHSAPVVT